jgi:tRNA(Ile)-lysidine synthase
MSETAERVWRIFREALGPGPQPDRVLVGYSGGPDSTALLHLVLRMKRGGGPEVVAAHLDHGIRPDSGEDLAHCRSVAGSLGIPLVSDRADVPALVREGDEGIEATARRARYEFLARVAAETGSEWIALGHTLDDQAETVLMRVIRGTGIRGLGGIPPERVIALPNGGSATVVRPLLDVRRAELLDLLAEEGLAFVRDDSNEDLRFTRNRLREKVMRLLKTEFNPSVHKALASLGGIAREWFDAEEKRVGDLVEGSLAVQGDGIFLSRRLLADDPMGMHFGLRRAFERLGLGEGALGSVHFRAAEALLRGEENPVHTLPGGVFMEAASGGLVIFRGREEAAYSDWRAELGTDGFVEPPGTGLRLWLRGPGDLPGEWRMVCGEERELIDAAEVSPPLGVRFRRAGDRFRPLGGPGERKLKKILSERGVPLGRRDAVPLVVDREGRILWIVGFGISDEVKIGESTKAVYFLEAENLK